MKNIKISSFIFILITIFFIIDFIGYRVLSTHMNSDHKKDTKILYQGIKGHTSDFLIQLLYQYDTQKEQLRNKHKIVLDYMNDHDLNVSLDEIHAKINHGHVDNPYHIYITNKDLVIKNSTYKNDIGFDLSFAKETFEAHKAENIIGCSAPIREKTSRKFFFYTDSYLSKNGDGRSAILQVSYTYIDTTEALFALQELMTEHTSIKEVQAYSIEDNGYTYEISLKETGLLLKPDLQSKAISRKKALIASKKLGDNDLIVEHFEKEGINYQLLTMSASSNMVKDMKIIYTVLLDESDFLHSLEKLDILMTLIALMGLSGIFIIVKVRDKEIRLSDQDKFVQSAMHEIKTPLSIITLNNELRQLEQGTDSYSEEIDNALKTLHNSYRSMSFIMTKDKLTYELEILDLSQIVKERIEYFQTIAAVNDKKIIFDINSHCRVHISLIELTRLIDNSLYNAIKYSTVGSTIDVVLVNNNLSFHNQGEAIKNKEKVFHKYFRENKTVGGYGLGLNIIKNIADKYGIGIGLESELSSGTSFTYIFKCHTDDIS